MPDNAGLISKVRLGGGMVVGRQGLGCMGMSEFYGQTDKRQALATLERALELGVNMFDTADMYGLGANEQLLAPFLARHRAKALVATKFGYTRDARSPDDWSLDNRPEYIRQAVDRSLQRLGVEVIDLYYMHRRVESVPLDESIGAMADLVKAGKVRALGLSQVSAQELLQAHAIHPIAALQSEWSLFAREIESEILPVARSLGTTLVPYAPLGRGLLVGPANGLVLEQDDVRRHFPRFQDENWRANQRLVETLQHSAGMLGISTAQAALAWLYTKAERLGVDIVPIPGTRNCQRLAENVAASSIRLSDAEMDSLETLAGAVQGAAV